MHEAGERNRKSGNPVFVNRAADFRDAYVQSEEESYITYISKGVLSEDKSSPHEKEVSVVLPKRYDGLKSCYTYDRDREDFLQNAFASYDPSTQSWVDKLLIEKGYHPYSGGY
jgi:hypothetical protein